MKWFCLILLLVSPVCADERSECERLAPKYNAETEVVLWDYTRVDLLNDEYAIEVDWAQKWAEAIGQSTYYGIITKKKPAIILLVTDKKRDAKYVYRALVVCTKLNIQLYLELSDG